MTRRKRKSWTSFLRVALPCAWLLAACSCFNKPSYASCSFKTLSLHGKPSQVSRSRIERRTRRFACSTCIN
jgi:hypothetical protein